MYRVTTDEKSQPQIDALPHEALAAFAEACAVVEIAPWNGDSLNDDYPEAPVRTLAFGPARQGLLSYLILDDQRGVDLLDVLWLG